jgi:hypothetical protein
MDALPPVPPPVTEFMLRDYIRDCYKRNINPLPQLRKVYPENEWRYLSRLDLACKDKCKASDGWFVVAEIYADPNDPHDRTTRVYSRVAPVEPVTPEVPHE